MSRAVDDTTSSNGDTAFESSLLFSKALSDKLQGHLHSLRYDADGFVALYPFSC
jgi:hypothetical protein